MEGDGLGVNSPKTLAIANWLTSWQCWRNDVNPPKTLAIANKKHTVKDICVGVNSPKTLAAANQGRLEGNRFYQLPLFLL